MRRHALFAGILVLIVLAPHVSAATPEELEAEIKAQSERLQSLNKEIQATESTLKEVQGQKKSLEQELRGLDGSIKDLNLKINADEAAAQMLEAEIAALGYSVEEMRALIDSKRQGISVLFRQLQREEERNIFLVVFGQNSLAESLGEMQAMSQVRGQLEADIGALRSLVADYDRKIEVAATKKTQAQLRKENLKNRKFIIEDKKEERAAVLKETRSEEAVYQARVKALKVEQDKLADQIEELERNLSKDFDRAVLPLGKSGVLSWPVADYVITQRFGVRSWLYRGKGHNGLDLGISVGTPIFAAADGVVTAVDNNDRSTWNKYQYGKYVLLTHENGLATLYAHLSKYTVSGGATVKRGDLIGYSGNTGYSTGPHLHFGLYWASSIQLKSVPPAAGLVPVGVVLDPQTYL